MPAPVLLIAIGNESRGDDALAPLLVRRLGRWLHSQGLAEHVELMEEFQLQVENTLDMQGRELLLFVDAGMNTPAPFSFYRAVTGDTQNLFSHAMSPEAVLALYQQIHHEAAPPAFVLCICGEQFELGEPISAQAEERLDKALGYVQDLLQHAEEKSWETCVRSLKGSDKEMLAI